MYYLADFQQCAFFVLFLYEEANDYIKYPKYLFNVIMSHIIKLHEKKKKRMQNRLWCNVHLKLSKSIENS